MHLGRIPKYWRRKEEKTSKSEAEVNWPPPLSRNVAHLPETRRASPLFGTRLDGFGLNGSCLVFIKLTLVHVCTYA